MNFPDGMTASDWKHVEGELEYQGASTVTLTATVTLTFTNAAEDEQIQTFWSPGDAARTISHLLHTGLRARPDSVEVEDIEWSAARPVE